MNGAGQPAAPGSVIVLFATGEGQTSPSGVNGKPASSPLPQPLLPVSVTIGGTLAAHPAKWLGVMQVNVQIPTGVSGSSRSKGGRSSEPGWRDNRRRRRAL